MKTYKIKSSAVRAAKKEMGDNWMDIAIIINVGEEFAIELKSTAQIKKDVAVVEDLAAIEAASVQKAAKKAEIESRKPVHIPAKPAHEAVAAIPAPKSIPALPAFLKIAPLAEKEVPELNDEEVEMMKAAEKADKIANAIAVNSDSAKPRMSTTEKPTKKVWHVADAMYIAAKEAGLPMPKRKDVIEECVRQGIAYGTSRTQYQHWFKCFNDSQVAPIATIGADGKIVPPTK